MDDAGQNSAADGRLARKKILLIDDEESVLHALQLLLEALGFSVLAFSNGKAALEHLSADTLPDFVLCDLRMPEMDGLKVLKQIRKNYPTLPAALMSAHAAEDEIAIARGIGINRFLGKPFTVDELKAVINS
jgi:CheY-like chemotaxis protein